MIRAVKRYLDILPRDDARGLDLVEMADSGPQDVIQLANVLQTLEEPIAVAGQGHVSCPAQCRDARDVTAAQRRGVVIAAFVNDRTATPHHLSAAKPETAGGCHPIAECASGSAGSVLRRFRRVAGSGVRCRGKIARSCARDPPIRVRTAER